MAETKSYQLNSAEQKLIDAHRAKEQREARIVHTAEAFLRIACDWYEYRKVNECGSSFSEFVNYLEGSRGDTSSFDKNRLLFAANDLITLALTAAEEIIKPKYLGE